MTASERLSRWADEVEGAHRRVEAHVGPCCLFCVGVSWPCEAIQGARIVRAMLAVERDATELIDPARMLEAGAAALEGDGR